MKSKNNTFNIALWWLVLILLGLAGTTIWWYDREISRIDQQIENMKEK